MPKNYPKTHKKERFFFLGVAIFFLLANLIGFSTSLNSRLSKEGSLHFHIYVHGFLAAMWILLYFIQTLLIARNNTKFHMQLGKLGALILFLILVSGFYVAFMVPVIYNVEPPFSQPGRDFSAILLAVIAALLGLKNRNKPFVHKRLMLTATLILSSAGIGRMVSFFGLSGYGPGAVIGFLFLPLLALVISDLILYRKLFGIHLASLFFIAALFIISAPPFWENSLIQPGIERLVRWMT